MKELNTKLSLLSLEKWMGKQMTFLKKKKFSSKIGKQKNKDLKFKL